VPDRSRQLPEPGAADCGDALRRLHEFLDGELTAERRHLIRTHLDACACCLEAFDFEAELRVVISTCCRDDAVPEGLRLRVVAALEELGEARGEL
jgi:anti-sigma factor (TIGR02949 family)